MTIHLIVNWEVTFENYLQKQIKMVDPCQGWWWDDQRFDHEFGVSGEIFQNYDSARHAAVESVLIPLNKLTIVHPEDEREKIRTVIELIEFIQMGIIDEFSEIDCGDFPSLRLRAGFRTIADYGAKIYSNPAIFLEINFEFVPDI